jgi:hypothetical protein
VFNSTLLQLKVKYKEYAKDYPYYKCLWNLSDVEKRFCNEKKEIGKILEDIEIQKESIGKLLLTTELSPYFSVRFPIY